MTTMKAVFTAPSQVPKTGVTYRKQGKNILTLTLQASNSDSRPMVYAEK